MFDTKIEVILEIFFLKFSNTNILFREKKLIWRFYIINKALSIIKQIQIINKIDFIMVELDTNNEIFIIYMAN